MYRSKLKQLAFEDYFNFYRDNAANELTTHELKQILGVHGLERLKCTKKEKIWDAVRSLDLVPPTRSTIHNGTVQLCSDGSGLAPPLEELQRDIKQLGWQECSIGSVETFKPSGPSVANGGVFNHPIARPKVFNVYVRRCKAAEKKKEKGECEKAKFKTMEKMNLQENAKLSVVMRTVRVPVEESKNYDKYRWIGNGRRKYGALIRNVESNQIGLPKIKSLPSAKNLMWYYRCIPKSCPVRKTVTLDPNDVSTHIITYTGEHNHAIP